MAKTVLVPLFSLLALLPSAAFGKSDWKAVDKLVNEQKFEAANTEVQKIREAAQAAGDEEEWTKALIREVQLRTALHGYETSVRFLMEQPWPKGSLQKDVLQLFYAWSLVNYFGAYQYEIQQRERVATTATVDLKAWTADQIYSAAHGAYAEVWKDREALGKEPVAKLATYLNANNYPKGVRGTLRDAVSYLFVELLADTRGWSPAQSNDLFQLPFAALLKGDPAKSAAVKLEDGAVHPMVKLAAVLDDLETWHAEKKEREGALEARLERLRRLFASFSEDPDRDAVEKELASRLEKGRDVPWWSMGKAQLARFVMARGKTGALVRARAIALEGEAAWPHEVGGLTCRSIVKQIEAPDFQVQSMQSDGLEKRSIQVTHKNLPALHFRAYPVDLAARIASSQDYNLLPSGYEMKKLFGGKPAAEWKVELPATPDYRSHVTFVTPPLSKKGLYAIVVSARADFAAANNRIMGVDLIITDLAMTARQDSEDSAVDVQVFEAATGKPAANAEVTLYRYDYSTKHRPDSTKTVDAEGMTRFQKKNDRGGGSYFLLAKRGDDYALDTNYLGFWGRSEPQENTTTLTYTDRSIYRPLQKVLFKVIAFRGRGDQARYRTLPETPVTVFLRDANGQEVAKLLLKTNSFGTASGEFAIPAGRLLGTWNLQTSYGGYSQIRVEEYKRPTFEASFKDPKDPLRLNRPATLTGEVKYYFGLPVTNGQVRWRVTREPVWPFWWFWYYGAVNVRAQTIATGNAALAKDGTFKFTFTPAADERKGIAKDVSWRYAVTADVTDEGGETRSASRAFRLGFTAVEAQVQAETAFFREGQKAAMKIRRTDLDGVPRAGKGRWRLVALSQPKSPLLPSDQPRPKRPIAADAEGEGEGGGDAGGDFETPGDKLRPRWDASYSPEAVLRGFGDGAEKASGALVHDDKGEAAVPLPALSAGAWRIHYETQDDFGATYKTQKEFVVAGKDLPVMLPAWLAVEDTSVKVGGTARLVAFSGFPGQTLYLDLWHNGRRYQHRRLEAGKDSAVIEIPVKEEDRGGFGITLTVLRDHQIMTFSSAVFVPWDDRELKLEFATFRDKLRPGAKETFKVTVKGPPGAKPEAAGAELLAYMYDKSLDVFAPHNPPSPMSLWPSRTGVSWAHATLGPAYAQYIENRNFAEIPGAPSLIPDRLKMESGYGIGGPGYRNGHGRMRSMAYKGAPADGDSFAEREEVAAAAPASMPVGRSAGPAQHAAGGGKSGGAMDKLEANKKSFEFDDATVEGKPEAPLQLRSNFAETAFFQPALLAGPDGSATIEFQVPDSVTAWNVWVHAVTKDLTSGSIHKETKSVKELMVRPYVPRFLREGDQAELKVVVNDASDKDLAGKLTISIEDPDTHEDIAGEFGLAKADLERPFKAEKGGGANVSFALSAPRKVRMAAIQVVARAGEFSDGELRPVPVLPSRMHLIQSRFVTLRDKDKRTMTFDDLKTADPTRINDQMVVTVDAQLFYTVLEALPYLIDYPYECTEQTLNRFVSTAIVTSVFRDFPAVAKMAEELAKKRDTPLETFDQADPNRKMALEESPWLNQAQGGKTSLPVLKVLDPKIATAQRDGSLQKLRKAQTANGGFPWFPGGPPDPYMTLYIMYGFAKASEFKADVPKDVVQRGWQYLASHFHEEYARHLIKDDCCWEWLTFLNYVASSYPDPSWVNAAITEDERKEILDFSFKHWKKHSPYLKGLLALTLKRAGRPADAKLVWASVMDSAKTKQDEGTYWAAEDRSWLWYNDTIETHAFALRTLLELEPANPKKDGLVLWLLLNKKLNQWKSTKATAEVIYSLVHYLKREKALGIREDMKVSIGGQTTQFVFEPDKYTGKKNQIVVPGEKVSEATATVTVEKQSKGFAFASTTWHFSTEKLPEAERGDFFNVKRTYFRRVNDGKEWTLQPLADGAKIAVGDELEVQLSLRSKHPAEYVHLRDPRGAGFEPSSNVSRWKWDYGTAWYEEVRDSGTNFFFGWLPQGEYTFKYRMRASMAGTFRVGPATVQSMYAPEFNAYSAGNMLSVAAAR